MDNPTGCEQDIVRRYMRGTLMREELSDFEIYLLDHPEIVDDVERVRAIQDALARSRHLSHLGSPYGHSLLRSKYTIAAAAAMAVILILSVLQYRQVTQLRNLLPELTSPITGADEVWLKPMLGDRVRFLEKSPSRTPIIRVDVSSMPATDYDVALRSDATSWTMSGLTPDRQDSIRIVLSDLPAGEYELTVSADRPASPIGSIAVYQLSVR